MVAEEHAVWIPQPAADFIADLVGDIRQVFPDAKTKTICNPERTSWRMEVYTSALNADDILSIVEDKVAHIMLNTDIAITVVPLALSNYSANGASTDHA